MNAWHKGDLNLQLTPPANLLFQVCQLHIWCVTFVVAVAYSYIYKRLKFLGNKLLSQALSLLFLAVWHGLHCGYLVCFQMEFLIVIIERQVRRKCQDRQELTHTPACYSWKRFHKRIGTIYNKIFEYQEGCGKTAECQGQHGQMIVSLDLDRLT